MATARERQFDLAKGVAILAVILHHVTSNAARKYTEDHSSTWWGLMVVNRLSHIAVPMFLFFSALLIARSLAKRTNDSWFTFYRKRLPGVLWPYVVWMGIYIAFRLFVVKNNADVYLSQVELPLIGSVQGPALLTHWQGWVKMIFLGKAYFHIYFMAVLLQSIIAFPLIALVAKLRLNWWTFLGTALAVQWLWYFIQGNYIDFSSPGSLFPSYIGPILVGAWLGLRWDQAEFRKASGFSLGLATTMSVGAYLAAGMIRFAGTPVSTTVYNMLYMASACTLGLALLNACAKWSESTQNRWLERIGEASLGLYLLHPILIYSTGGPRLSAFLQATPFPPLFLLLFVLAGSILILALLHILRLDRWIFGRPLVSKPKLGVEPTAEKVGSVSS